MDVNKVLHALANYKGSRDVLEEARREVAELLGATQVFLDSLTSDCPLDLVMRRWQELKQAAWAVLGKEAEGK
jgi:GAF domain-containing protein